MNRSRAASAGFNQLRRVRERVIGPPLRCAPGVRSGVRPESLEHPAVMVYRVVAFGRLDNFNDFRKTCVLQNAAEWLPPDGSFTNPVVAIQSGPRGGLGIVEVEAFQMLQAHYPVELVQDAGDIPDDVVP